MANAWIIEPLPATVQGAAGTLQLGQPAYVLNDYSGVVCQLACDTGSNEAFIRLDLGSDVAIDTIMVFGVELIPPAGTLHIATATSAQGPFTGSFTDGGSAPAYCGTAPMTSGKGVSLWSASSPVTARYVQLSYFGSAAGQAVRLSRIVINRRIQLGRNFGNGGSFGVRDLGALDFSARGVLQRRRGKKLRTVSVSFANAYKDEVEAYTKPLQERIGNTEMIGFVADPTDDPQRMNRCYFGPLVGDLSQAQRKAQFWEVKVNVVSIF